MKDLFYALSQQTVYYRFISRKRYIPRKEIQDFAYIDYRTDIAIAGTLPEAHGEDIVAIGRYYLDEETNFAEVAFVIHDNWQNRGIGTYLLDLLAGIAKSNGISGFTAEVLRENRAMQRVFQRSPYKVTSIPAEDVISFRIEFS
jgi:GNAT superfamily N-acetyltransferase